MEGWFDGGSRGNPGIAGAGWVLKQNSAIVQAGYVYVGDHSTNNQSEYSGLIALLEAAVAMNCDSLNVYGDSLLVIQQMKGNWQIKDFKMRALHTAAIRLISQIGHVTFAHILRHLNTEADMLSNMAMDNQSSRIGTDLLTDLLKSSTTVAKTDSYVGPTCAVRIRREKGRIVQDCDVWVGSAWTKGGWKLTRSIWCNPFVHISDREQMLNAYKKYICSRPDMIARIDTELKGRRLGCFCEENDSTCHAVWLSSVAEDPTLLAKK